VKVDFFEGPTLSELHLKQAADLAFLAFEDFYSLFSEDRSVMHSVIVEQLKSFSELNQHIACFQNNMVAGICAFYNITEMSERQTAGILGLLRAVRDIVGSTNELSRYRKQFVIPTTDGVYISRFAIDKGMRGSGLASDLLHNAESNFQRLGAKRVSLHVRRDNKQALAFYVHAGYEPRVNQNLGYILLGKDLLDRTDRI
jgi:ribosomal protein S18 acetylase RimI-like enzyme